MAVEPGRAAEQKNYGASAVSAEQKKQEYGKFIVLEGISGSGKDTQSLLLASYLRKLDIFNEVLLTAEPTRSQYGSKVRELMSEHKRKGEDPRAHAGEYLELFIQDRLEHLEYKIEPMLRQGVHVISARYYHSTIVHQQSDSLPAEEIVAMHEKAKVRRPDLTVILDLTAHRAMGRIIGSQEKGERKEKGIHETQQRLTPIRERYLELPRLLPEEKIIIVPGIMPSPDDVFNFYKPAIDRLLGR